MYNRYDVLRYFEGSKDFYSNVVYPNIEKYRKGNMKITLVDSEGRKIDNCSIKVKQISHEFKFGANLFMLDEMETEEKNSLYKSSFKDIFNMATLPFYWCSIEPEKGKTRYNKDAKKSIMTSRTQEMKPLIQ